MRHSFSAEFLRISPPAMNFGEAWENLCLCLLRADTADGSIMKLGPPDRGIDIFRQNTREAYQCKSSERGVLGTIEPQECITSLERAIEAKTDIMWRHYSIALNAPLSGVGFSKITNFAMSRNLPESSLSILAPEHWNDLCERHTTAIQHLFDYRVFISEAQVVEALRKAQYYDHFVQQAVQHMKAAPLDLAISNNRTPVELTMPFSGELTVEQLLDVVKSILGISLDWANFPDLGTSCGPSLSMTVGQVPQSFKLKLSELTVEQRAKLQLWIKLVWRDKLQTEEDHYDGTKFYCSFMRLPTITPERPAAERARGRMTLDRMQSIVQTTIWQSLSQVR